VLLDRSDRSSKGQIGVDRIGDIHWNAHRRRADKIRDIAVEGLDNGGLPYGQLAVVIGL
jgi:hypothetical protein